MDKLDVQKRKRYDIKSQVETREAVSRDLLSRRLRDAEDKQSKSTRNRLGNLMEIRSRAKHLNDFAANKFE